MFKFLSLILSFFLVFQPVQVMAALGEISISDELEMGREFELIIKTQLPIIEDPEIKNYVQAIVDNLVAQISAQPYDFKVNVILNNSLNAFAAPGGYITLYSGLIQRLEHESELAGILAHEISHISQRHIAKSFSRNNAINLLSIGAAIAAMAVGGSGGGAVAAGSLAAAQTAMLKYSRIDESESDYLALSMLTDAGYNPNGLTSAFEKMQVKQWQTTSNIPSYMSTHPDLSTRIVELKSRVQGLDDALQELPDHDTQFLRVQTLVWAKYVDAKQAEIYFKNKAQDPSDYLSTLGLAIVYSRQNKIQEANKLFAQVLEQAGTDPLVLREAGIFQFDKADINLAEDYLTKALKIDSKDYMAQFYLARLYDYKKEYSKAHDLYEKVLLYVPMDNEVHTYYARSLGRAGQEFEANLHFAYAALYHYNTKQVENWLKKAEALAQSTAQKKELEEFKKLYEETKKLYS